MLRTTALNELHRQAGGRMIAFAGFELPLHFGSQIREHHAVRREAGMFDVSHMAIFDVAGERSRDFLRCLLANDVDRLAGPGRGLYSCLLNEAGGVIDDALAFARVGGGFRLVTNAATRERVGQWLHAQAAHFAVEVRGRDDLSMIAVQGPEALSRLGQCLPPGLREVGIPRFGCAEVGEWFVARTGYTGEDGCEIALPGDAAVALWRSLAAAGVVPCGLGARDTLRLEAGLRLYGQDMDETVTPLESGLGWTVAFEPAERTFIGREALERQRRREPGLPRFVGLILEEPGVLRHGQRVVVPGHGEGLVTSGSYVPTLDCSVAFARLPAGDYQRCFVDIRGRNRVARVTGTRFLQQVRS